MQTSPAQNPSSRAEVPAPYPDDVLTVDLLDPSIWLQPGVLLFLIVAFLWVFVARHGAQKNIRKLNDDVEQALATVKSYDQEVRKALDVYADGMSNLEKTTQANERHLATQAENLEIKRREVELLEQQVALITRIEALLEQGRRAQ